MMEKDEGYDSGDSDTDPRSSVILNSSNFIYGDDPNAYKKDKSCGVCQKSFSIIGSMKKLYCKICYRGVCAGCSKHRAPDINGKNSRICDSCYQKTIHGQVKDSLQKEVDRVAEEIEEIQKSLVLEKEQRKHESYRRDLLERQLEQAKVENRMKEKKLVQKSEELEEEIKIMRVKIEEFTKVLAGADSIKNKMDAEIDGLRQETNLLRGEAQADIDKISDLKRLIEEQDLENQRLEKELQSHKSVLGDNDDPYIKENLMDELKFKLANANETFKESKKDNEAMKKKLAALKEANSEKKLEISRIDDVNVRKRSVSKISLNIKELEDQLVYQQQEIERLQAKLNSDITPK